MDTTVSDALEPTSPTGPPARSPWRSRTVAVIALALVIVVALDLAARLTPDRGTQVTVESNVRLLEKQPSPDEVYIMSNSIFHTAVVLDELAAALPPGIGVYHQYHQAQYTDAFYLLAKTAIPAADEKPALVVWTFRPHTGIRPGLAPHRPWGGNFVADPDYERVLAGASRVDAGGDELLDLSEVIRERDRVQDGLEERARSLALDVLSAAGVSSVDELAAALERDVSLQRLLTEAFATGDVLPEQLVDDLAELDRGDDSPRLPFAQGFVPLTALALQDAEIPQLAIMFRSGKKAIGAESDLEDAYAADAVRWFAGQGIPLLDLWDDDAIRPGLFAWGDHYNARGRAVLTPKIADAINDALRAQP